MPRYNFTREDVLSQEEVQEMLDKARVNWVKALIAMLYIYGCRVNEALHMRRRDFSIVDGQLHANIPVSKKGKQQQGAFDKSRHILRVSLEAPFMKYLTDYLATIVEPDEYVWQIGGTWKSASTTAWREIKALNPKCTPHIFRHTRLTKLALKGASALALQDWAGWKDTRPAQNYLHLSGKLAKEFADQVD